MTDLAGIHLGGYRPAATQFRNLRFHRIYILEGLARTAHRNMRHMTDARDRIGPRQMGHTEPSNGEWIAQIQAEMLSDHGISDAEVILGLPWFSTVLPVKVYFAALYAEVEFLQRHARHLWYLLEEGEMSLFEYHGDLINVLKDFRHGFLKPQTSTVRADARLFNGGIFNGVPGLLASIDQVIARMRYALKAEFENLLDRLPKEQAVLCRFLYVQECRRNSIVQGSTKTREAIDQAMIDVLKVASSFATEVRNLDLSMQEIEKASLVVELLNSVSEYEEMTILGDVPEYDTLQPPFEPGLLLSLLELQAQDMPSLTLYGRTVAHIADHIDHYMMFLYTSDVFANETYQLIRQTAPNRTFQTINDMESASRNVPMREAIRVTSLNLSNASMLIPILEMYQTVRSENPHAAVPALDQIIDDKEGFLALVRFRNSVFHVEQARVGVENRDNAVLRRICSTEFLSELTEGVAQFLTIIQLGTVERVKAGKAADTAHLL